jgi:hypothetical protein
LWLDTKIEDAADSYARDIAPKLRRLLAVPSFSSMLTALEDSISGRELIHTSYFDHAEVLDLLTMHMGRARGDVPWRSYRKTQHEEIEDIIVWLDAFYDANLLAVGNQPAPSAPTQHSRFRIRADRRSSRARHHEASRQDAA